MTDLGSFAVQSEALRTQAIIWEEHATHARACFEPLDLVRNQGYKFGYLAGQNGVSEAYNMWSTAMVEAVIFAGLSFDYLKNALIAVADNYDGVDSTVGTDFATLDLMIEEDYG